MPCSSQSCWHQTGVDLEQDYMEVLLDGEEDKGGDEEY